MTNLKEKLENVQTTGIKVVNGGGSNAVSLSIVNSDSNGKRLTTSKELTKKLNLTDTLYVVPNVEDNELYLSSVPMMDISSSGKLSGNDKKVCYSAGLVSLIVETFRLDYTGKTSMSFNNISFDELDEAPVAVVKIDPEKQINPDAVSDEVSA